MRMRYPIAMQARGGGIFCPSLPGGFSLVFSPSSMHGMPCDALSTNCHGWLLRAGRMIRAGWKDGWKAGRRKTGLYVLGGEGYFGI